MLSYTFTYLSSSSRTQKYPLSKTNPYDLRLMISAHPY